MKYSCDNDFEKLHSNIFCLLIEIKMSSKKLPFDFNFVAGVLFLQFLVGTF